MIKKEEIEVRVQSGTEIWNRLQKGESVRIVDVREPHEFRSGHIPGAELIPMGNIPAALYEFKPDEEVVFVCRSGARSNRVCQFLSAQGYRNIVNMRGGMMQWPGPVEQ
jgi:rhodanese-related sulfurtransferase